MMNMKSFPTIVCALLLMAQVSFAQGWQTIGANSRHNGRGDVTGPLAPDVLWQGTTESTWFGCQCYISGSRMVTMRFQGVDVSPIVCYDVDTGQELWSLDFPGQKSRSMPLGCRDGRIYAVNYQENAGGDDLYALDPLDGSTIWVAPAMVRFSIVHALTYADNGDLIVPTMSYIARIDCADGSVVWQTNRNIPNTMAESLCVYGDRIYGFEGFINTGKKLVAYDLTSGVKLYESADLPGDGDQECPLMVDSYGRIYVIRDGSGLIRAFDDTGSGFSEVWTTPTATGASGMGTWSQFGTGIDGTLYFVDAAGDSLQRLDPETGGVLDLSPTLATEIHPRVTVASNGLLYVSTGTVGGSLYCLTPDLAVLWSETFNYNYYSGPALGDHGTLAMAGDGTNIKVYRTDNTLVADAFEISMAAGGTVHFTLRAGQAHAGRNYLLCGSLSGTDPGTLLPGGLVTIPLNRDWFTTFILEHLYWPVFSEFWGVLDAQGEAVVTMEVPPLGPQWYQWTLYFAFATTNPWDFASIPVEVFITD